MLYQTDVKQTNLTVMIIQASVREAGWDGVLLLSCG